jgi:hypothetical protein
METKVKKAISDFIGDQNDIELEFDKKIAEDKKKFIKSDNSIIERIDKIYLINENGIEKQLLREIY